MMNLLNQQLSEGAFLTAEYNGKVNAMTIGWGMEGRCWQKPVFIAMVRPSRYTYEILKQSNTFTISVPKKGQMKEELVYFGSHSGREENKFQNAKIDLLNAKNVTGKVIGDCGYYYECSVLYAQEIDPDCFVENSSIKNTYYPQEDFHLVLYGEIVDSYENE